MDYYDRIQNAIEYIENNLGEELSISDIAFEACFSPFHFQRLFQAISGFSVQEYIRKRRMTEAAALLKTTEKNILEVAVTYQYGSQEAFARAFESCFGMAPGKYRKAEIVKKHLNKINFSDYRKKIKGEVNMNIPDIVQLEKIHIAGYEYKTTLTGERYFNEIPMFYNDFGQNEYYLRIKDRISPAFPYGIGCNYRDDGSFTFIVGEAVMQPDERLDKGFVNFEIPGGKYAEFRVSGPVGIAQNTWRYIYGTWLPNSNYERREGPDFEVTDVCNSSYPDCMNMKIFIPVT